MKFRTLGKTGFNISEISLGTWQVGGKWGAPFSHENADAILHKAIDLGVNFIDTADVYGNRESEKAVGRLVKNRSERIYVATKCGRFINPHVNERYTPQVLREYVETSLKNMVVWGWIFSTRSSFWKNFRRSTLVDLLQLCGRIPIWL